MSPSAIAKQFLEREARALRTRIDRLVPLSATMSMVPAAGIPVSALSSIEQHLREGRRNLRHAVERFVNWLKSEAGRASSAADAQRRFTLLKLRFNSALSQFDIFADVLVQRSELGTGICVAGLDDLAADALQLPGFDYPVPDLICYLDRGHGAAIRRARTRLPGGDLSPVAVIKVPRERMVGQGIGASLVHEVGHQAAAVLNLINPMRLMLQERQRRAPVAEKVAWICWERWISEIVADMWAVAKLGVGATFGLIGVVGLPRFFVFRIDLDDPHPFPWIRVMASIAMGKVLFPHPQWERVAGMWQAMYPQTGLHGEQAALIELLKRALPQFAFALLNFRPAALRGQSLLEALSVHQRTPERLMDVWDQYHIRPQRWHELPPTLAFAAISQARVEGKLSPEGEARLISRLLLEWAVKSSLSTSEKLSREPRTMHSRSFSLQPTLRPSRGQLISAR